jgi:hypothetical protein
MHGGKKRCRIFSISRCDGTPLLPFKKGVFNAVAKPINVSQADSLPPSVFREGMTVSIPALWAHEAIASQCRLWRRIRGDAPCNGWHLFVPIENPVHWLCSRNNLSQHVYLANGKMSWAFPPRVPFRPGRMCSKPCPIGRGAGA